MTFIAALRLDGITAPLVLDQPINGAWFLAYVEQILAPTLRPGDVVIMDNLGSHKADERSVEAVWRRIGTLLDLFSAAECANYIRHAGYASV